MVCETCEAREALKNLYAETCWRDVNLKTLMAAEKVLKQPLRCQQGVNVPRDKLERIANVMESLANEGLRPDEWMLMEWFGLFQKWLAAGQPNAACHAQPQDNA